MDVLDRGVGLVDEVWWHIIPEDGHHSWEPVGRREVDFDHLKQVAGAVDRLGYSGTLFATGAADVWVLATRPGPRPASWSAGSALSTARRGPHDSP